MAENNSFNGGCHCGAVRYQVSGLDLGSTITCNCSRCSMTGSILTFVSADSFALKSGEDHLTDYQFNKKLIHHLFCDICGIQSFSRATGQDGKAGIAINVRCLDNVDLEALSPQKYDGRSV